MTELINQEKMNWMLERIGALVTATAIRNCPQNIGRLRNSIRYRIEGDTVTIFSRVKYAPWVEFGTGVFHINEEGFPEPHESWDIVPVNKKALAWGKVIGKTASGANKYEHVAKKVHIEGMHPKPFMRPAIHQNMGGIREIILKGLAR